MQAQGRLDGMPARLWPATPSKLGLWSDCPRAWRFSYLERREKGRPWAHHGVGAAAHLALREWWVAPREQRTPGAAAQALRRAWPADGFADEAMRESLRERWAQLVAGYVEQLDPDDEPVGVERTVATTSGQLALSGRIDRLDRRPRPADVPPAAVAPDRDDELVVVDYKTGRRPLTTDDVRSSLALAIYAAAAQRTLRTPCTAVELHHLPTGDRLAWRHTPESLARHLRRAEAIGAEARAAQQAWREEGLEQAAAREGRRDGEGTVSDPGAAAEVDAVLAPAPSGRCGWCDYRRWCAEGQGAAAAQPPWAGVVEPA